MVGWSVLGYPGAVSYLKSGGGWDWPSQPSENVSPTALSRRWMSLSAILGTDEPIGSKDFNLILQFPSWDKPPVSFRIQNYSFKGERDEALGSTISVGLAIYLNSAGTSVVVAQLL